MLLRFLTNAAPSLRNDASNVRRLFTALRLPLTKEGFKSYQTIYATLLQHHCTTYAGFDWEACAVSLHGDAIFFEGECSSYILAAANPHQSLLVREQQLVCTYGRFEMPPEEAKRIFQWDTVDPLEVPWFQFRSMGYSTRATPWRRVCFNSLLARHSSEFINGFPRKATFNAKVETFATDDRRDASHIHQTPGGDDEPMLSMLKSIDLEETQAFMRMYGDSNE